jgi:hypothetical protein
MTKDFSSVQKDYSSMEYLTGCIGKWSEANDKKGRYVEFFSSFIIWDVSREGDVEHVDDRICVFGIKETILASMKEVVKMVEEDEEEFISW